MFKRFLILGCVLVTLISSSLMCMDTSSQDLIVEEEDEEAVSKDSEIKDKQTQLETKKSLLKPILVLGGAAVIILACIYSPGWYIRRLCNEECLVNHHHKSGARCTVELDKMGFGGWEMISPDGDD